MTTHVTTAPATSAGSTRVVTRFCTLQKRAAAQAQPYFLLLARVVVGYALVLAGKGKLGNLEGVTAFFTELGIPAARMTVVMVGSIELFGGLLLIAGLASRLAAMLLTGVLAVALVIAHWAQVAAVLSDPASFLSAAPVPYLMAVILVALVGPGRFAVDELIQRRSHYR